MKILLVAWQLGCAYGVLIGYNGATHPESSWFGNWTTFWIWLLLFATFPVWILLKKYLNRTAVAKNP